METLANTGYAAPPEQLPELFDDISADDLKRLQTLAQFDHTLAVRAMRRVVTSPHSSWQRIDRERREGVKNSVLDAAYECYAHNMLYRLPTNPEQQRRLRGENPDYYEAYTIWVNAPNDPDRYQQMRAFELADLALAVADSARQTG